MKWSSDKCDVTFCRFLRWAAQIPYQASWSEEKDWKPDWQRIPGAGQEQPSNIQLLGLVKCAILTQQMSMYMTNGMKVRLLFWDPEKLNRLIRFHCTVWADKDQFYHLWRVWFNAIAISFYGWGMGRGFTSTHCARLGPILAIPSLWLPCHHLVAACLMSHHRRTQKSYHPLLWARMSDLEISLVWWCHGRAVSRHNCSNQSSPCLTTRRHCLITSPH